LHERSSSVLVTFPDSFLNTLCKDKIHSTIYMKSGVKLTGRIRLFDKYSVLLENNGQEQLIFRHAISKIISDQPELHRERRPPHAAQRPVSVENPISEEHGRHRQEDYSGSFTSAQP
jgi:host factor-I protein